MPAVVRDNPVKYKSTYMKKTPTDELPARASYLLFPPKPTTDIEIRPSRKLTLSKTIFSSTVAHELEELNAEAGDASFRAGKVQG